VVELEEVELEEEGKMFQEKKTSMLTIWKIIKCGNKNPLPVKVSLFSLQMI
jgi:hypothetical protein